MSELVINGLVRKRAELAGEIQYTQAKLRTLMTDVGSLDSAIKVFDPDYKVVEIKAKAFRPEGGLPKRGDVTRNMLDVLREATGAMTTRQIAEAIGKSVKSTGIALCGQRKKGIVKSQRAGKCVAWEICAAI